MNLSVSLQQDKFFESKHCFFLVFMVLQYEARCLEHSRSLTMFVKLLIFTAPVYIFRDDSGILNDHKTDL